VDGFAFVEITTGGAAPGDTLPLILALHGLGDRPESFVELFDGFSGRARIVVPRPETEYAGGYSWFQLERGSLDSAGPGIAARADSLAAFLQGLLTRRPTRGKPIVTGFSQGGALSFAIAARHPDVIAAAVPVAGWLPESVRSGRAAGASVAVVAFHGTADARVPVERSREAVDALGRLGFRTRLEEAEGVPHAIPRSVRASLHSALAQLCAEQAR